VPKPWRRIEVPANHTLEGLHDVIQIVMGWADCHLHHFQFGDVMYGVPTPEDREMNDGRKIKLSMALVDGERAFQYLYDYGDGWCCIVVLEAVAPAVPGVAYPRLVEGQGITLRRLFTSPGPDCTASEIVVAIVAAGNPVHHPASCPSTTARSSSRPPSRSPTSSR
jgi:Plasmid pRiA4b ORF-3-like protein